jgi:hypothetical protein
MGMRAAGRSLVIPASGPRMACRIRRQARRLLIWRPGAGGGLAGIEAMPEIAAMIFAFAWLAVHIRHERSRTI